MQSSSSPGPPPPPPPERLAKFLISTGFSLEVHCPETHYELCVQLVLEWLFFLSSCRLEVIKVLPSVEGPAIQPDKGSCKLQGSFGGSSEIAVH